MRYPTALALGLCLCLCASSASGGIHSLFRSGAAEPAQTPHPAIVRIEVIEPGAISHGSGSLVGADQNYGWVITNWHVIRGSREQVTVQFPDGYESPAVVMKTDQDWDLALLAIYRPYVSPLPLAPNVPVPGEPLFIAGYGQGKFRLAPGECLGYAAPDTGFPEEMIDVSVPARQGDSGGPIVNQYGQIAGVLFGSGSGLTTGTHVGRLRQFLSEVSVDLPTSTGDLAKTELAGQPMTSHRKPNVQGQHQGEIRGKPPDAAAEKSELPSMPAVAVQAPAATVPSEPRAVTPASVASLDLEASAGQGPVFDLPWLNPQDPWGETKAFFAFVLVVGVVLLMSPRKHHEG